MAGIDSPVPAHSHTSALSPSPSASASPSSFASSGPCGAPATAQESATAHPTGPLAAEPPAATPYTAVQDRLARWVADLSSLHELTERLAHATTLDDALRELLRAGAALVGAQRGMVAIEPPDGLGPDLTIGLGLGHAELGHIETIPRAAGSIGRLLDGLPERADVPRGANERPSRAYGRPRGAAKRGDETDERAGVSHGQCSGAAGRRVVDEVAHPDLANEDDLDPRHREVAARLGYAASYAVPLEVRGQSPALPYGEAGPGAPRGRIGAVVWLYDEPTEPTERQRRLVGLYCRYAAERMARHLELHRSRRALVALREELLPGRLPRVPGVRLAARHHTGPCGGGDWYDALALPDGALGLSVGGVTGGGPSAVAAMGRLRAALRAYAVLEGEDPVAVLSDLELLLRLTEPARAATALFAYCEPAHRSVFIAGAGHCPPLLIGEERTTYVETSLSAPLGMLACWEAPSVGVKPGPGETLLLYSDGLLHRAGVPMDRAFAQLHAAAASVPKSARHDPDAVVDHIWRTVLPAGRGPDPSNTDVATATAGTATAATATAGIANTHKNTGFGTGDKDIVLLAARFD
ncbi:PP2C family protein-serine/threonine phosphatase [Streptomyces zagrosensis]|uniref:PP2C family protein-serine/threonine phosphatase n=1 Tax=Streptomyces zagrosensis TaxID=1042984 RepID=UPI0035E3F9AF